LKNKLRFSNKMGNEDNEIDQRIIIIVFFLLLFICLFWEIRIAKLSQSDLTYEEICRYEFGEDWKYEYSYLFGKICVKIDYISLETIDRVAFNYTNSELRNKYCPNKTKFWNLKVWKSGCEGWRTSHNKQNGK